MCKHGHDLEVVGRLTFRSGQRVRTVCRQCHREKCRRQHADGSHKRQVRGRPPYYLASLPGYAAIHAAAE